MNRVDGIILDWAGTTVDFGCFAPVQVFLKIFQDVGIEVTMAEARGPMGMLKKDHIRTMLSLPRIAALWQQQIGRPFGETDVEALYSNFEPRLLASLASYVQPLPHVVDTVTRLKQAGLKIGSTTGYTDAMMQMVAAGAAEHGYAPDFWLTPDSTGSYGRPYPYMIFRNMEALRLKATWSVVKVGDTIADIQEGLQAGVWSVGVVIGSSQMGLSQVEFEMLSVDARQRIITSTEQEFLASGANFTIQTMQELPGLIEKINELIGSTDRPRVI